MGRMELWLEKAGDALLNHPILVALVFWLAWWGLFFLIW